MTTTTTTTLNWREGIADCSNSYEVMITLTWLLYMEKNDDLSSLQKFNEVGKMNFPM